MNVKDQIIDECNALAARLLAKNEAYGNSALDPIRIFSRADAVEQLKVRIDDKLSRLMRGQNTGAVPEDTIADLLGYLILLRIAQRSTATIDGVIHQHSPGTAAVHKTAIEAMF